MGKKLKTPYFLITLLVRCSKVKTHKKNIIYLLGHAIEKKIVYKII